MLLIFATSFSSVAMGQAQQDSEKLSINTNLVNLNVSVFNRESHEAVPELKQSDFAVQDNGEQQQIGFFTATSAPFDLVLLLDLSASTNDKMDLIKKSAIRFVEAARPTDRIGVVTFTSETKVVSPLTDQRTELIQRIKKLKKLKDGTSLWDALAFVLTDVIGTAKDGRRSAVIVMTDGVDNALPNVEGDGSRITFPQLGEVIYRSEATILPIYLDTEDEQVRMYGVPREAYELARKTLEIIARASGGVVYRAGKLEDLKDVYGSVIRDLGNFYSIGYQPAGDAKPGQWHTVSVQIVNQPNLIARTRSGYAAK
jgi:VWFA-related protein